MQNSTIIFAPIPLGVMPNYVASLYNVYFIHQLNQTHLSWEVGKFGKNVMNAVLALWRLRTLLSDDKLLSLLVIPVDKLDGPITDLLLGIARKAICNQAVAKVCLTRGIVYIKMQIIAVNYGLIDIQL
jgi:hypothetical protein